MAVVSAGGVGLRTDQPLASWRLLALTDSPPAPSLARVQALDAGHQPLATSWSPAAEVSAPLQLLPERFALRPNYPNPFNPATVIEFEVPSGVDGVRLEVYDILGQRVRVLVDGSVAAGVHRIRWDGRDTVGRAVASGAYFARLSAPGSRHVRPMLLLR
jgi:hypothetical protein